VRFRRRFTCGLGIAGGLKQLKARRVLIHRPARRGERCGYPLCNFVKPGYVERTGLLCLGAPRALLEGWTAGRATEVVQRCSAFWRVVTGADTLPGSKIDNAVVLIEVGTIRFTLVFRDH
jgi:hypothetical protein